MTPPNEKEPSDNHPISDSKETRQKFFSFKRLLRKSKSSRPIREPDKELITRITTSKSCDTELAKQEPIEQCPTYLFWKLLSPPGGALGHSKSSDSCSAFSKLPMRASFSCNDVPGLAHILQSPQTEDEKFDRHRGEEHRLSYFRQFKSNGVLSKLPPHDLFPQVWCKLCLSMVPASSMYELQDCHCSFCILCLHQYLVISVKEGKVPITCPDSSCDVSGKILVTEIQDIAGEDARFMFERYKLNLDVELDPTKVWCPAPGCETICTFQMSESESNIEVQCESCHLRFCSVCKLKWHDGSSCETARKFSNDVLDSPTNKDDSWIKKCPNCLVLIEKDEGCAQMMCYRCKHVFCWHCLASLDDDFLLKHYDKGPCRNKLGHSRASMIWHRTQVIGIFAGFSFLLLMASPFILLAAPCLLCCRCRKKFFYEEATQL